MMPFRHTLLVVAVLCYVAAFVNAGISPSSSGSEVTTCESFTCPEGYECIDDFKYIVCDCDTCTIDECCKITVPVTTCTDEILEVTLPDIPVSLQFGLLVDLSGSYSDDLIVIKDLARDLLEGLLYPDDGAERDLRLALGTFVDIPESPFGSSGDYDYREEKDFGVCAVVDAVCAESDRDAWTTALDALSTLSGADGPESQSIALMSAIEEWDWTTGYTKFLAITTDADFHNPDDDDRYFSVDDIIVAAIGKYIKIIALKAGDAGEEMDELAIGTGGSVQTTTTDSSDIVDGIIAGVEESTYGIVEVTSSCESPWTVVSGSPVTDVSGGSTVEIANEVCALDDTDSTCEAEMVADGTTLETFTFAVVDGVVVLT